MRTNITFIVVVLFCLGGRVREATAQSTVFTYQGKLNQNGVPFAGLAEIAPTLWDAASGGTLVAQNNPVTVLVDVSNGLFTASLDFGSAPFISGAGRWLQLGVRTSFGPYTILSPLQPLTATPYAITAAYAVKGSMATNFSGSLAGDVVGNQGATVVSRVGGQPAGLLATGAAAANAATSANAGGTIVKRDIDGNFTAGMISAGVLSAGTVVAGTFNGSVNASNITGTLPLARLSGITSNQMDASTWQFVINLALSTLPTPSGMVFIPGGDFILGNTMGDPDILDAAPVNANVSPFYMDSTVVTWSIWQGVYLFATNNGYTLNPGAGKGPSHPAQTVNWYDAVKWCNARSEQAGKTPVYYTDAGFTTVYRSGELAPYANWRAKGYRLPTEAEWEKAARGGLIGQRFPWGNLISQTNANYTGKTASFSYDLGPDGLHPLGTIGGSPYTSPVDTFAPNGYGLYDMAGNVLQFCWDWYATPYAGGNDPHGAIIGSRRVLRGGGWYNYVGVCRVASRVGVDILIKNGNNGFRCVLPCHP